MRGVWILPAGLLVGALAAEAVPTAPHAATGTSTPDAGDGRAIAPDATSELQQFVIEQRANGFLRLGGRAGFDDLVAVGAEIRKLSPDLRERLFSAGVQVVVCRDSVTDYWPALSGWCGPGWPAESTWDSVPGTYLAGTKEVIVATCLVRGQVRVPPFAYRHGSFNLLLHEIGHAMYDEIPGDGTKFASAFAADRHRRIIFRNHYEDYPSEAYAETVARYFGGDATFRNARPELYAFAAAVWPLSSLGN